MTVAVALPDLTVTAVDEEFRPLATGDLSTTGDRLALGPVHRRCAIGALGLDGPPARVGNDVLILLAIHGRFLAVLVS